MNMLNLLLALVSALTFAEKQALIEAHGAHWIAGRTSVSDLPIEQKRALLGLIPKPLPPERFVKFDFVPTKTHLDWRDVDGHSYVTGVRDQGQCGSCWAFGALAAMESRIKIAADDPDEELDLSEQYLVSCSPGGCSGYTLDGTANFLVSNGTIVESCMPYEADDGIPCSERCEDYVYKIRRLTHWNYTSGVNNIKAALQNGPVYVGFEVYEDFYDYRGGVYEHVYGEFLGRHAVAIIGYDDDSSAWICKNSWGSGWGENGYFKIRYGQCSIDRYALIFTPDEPIYPLFFIVDSDLVEDSGDGDGVLNPGEVGRIVFTLANHGSFATAQNPRFEIRFGDDGIVPIDTLVQTSEILPRETTQVSFRIRLSDSVRLADVEVELTGYANENGDHPYLAMLFDTIHINIYQAGWPVGLGSQMRNAPLMIPDTGLIAVSTLNGQLHVFDEHGSEIDGFPIELANAIFAAPALFDFDSDPTPELLVLDTRGGVHIIGLDGRELMSASVNERSAATPSVADIDSDGELEIVFPSVRGHLWAMNRDGTVVDGFPVDFSGSIRPVALGDIDGDGDIEIVASARDRHLYAFDGDGTPLSGNWPVELDGNGYAPIIVPADGQNVIVVSTQNMLFVISALGEVITSISVPNARHIIASDLDEDGYLELIAATTNGNIAAFKLIGQDLEPLWAYYLRASGVSAPPATGDLDGDGRLEVLVPTDDGQIYVFDADGHIFSQPMALAHHEIGGIELGHLDDDGDLEAALTLNTDVYVIDFKLDGGSLADGWAHYRATPYRTGNYSDIVPQSVFETRPSNRLRPVVKLSNPILGTRTAIRLELGAPAHVRAKLFDVSGRLVDHLLDRDLEIGEHEIDLKVPHVGVYFLRIEFGNGEPLVEKLVFVPKNDR